MLEIGCAEGAFLKEMKERSWVVIGVEPDKDLASYGREHWGLEIIIGMDIPPAIGDKKFDVIAMFHLIEHIPEPLAFLGKVKAYLQNDGLVYIETPDLKRPRGNIRKGFVNIVHPIIYTPTTLIAMLAKAGLEVTKMEDAEDGIRLLASPSSRPSKNQHMLYEDIEEIRRILYLHHRHWMLHAEWKEWIKGLLKR